MDKNTAAFIMPVKLNGSETEIRHFRASVQSIKNQTDSNWILIIIEDYSDHKSVYDAIDEVKKDLKDKVYVIYSDKNYGAGIARNKGIRYANEIGIPFIIFNDADDLSDPRRLELVRKAFEEDDKANVVYTSFNVIDENDNIVPLEKVSLPVREIIYGHRQDVVEGENAWINIATKKKYTNLTSCTAARTSLAIEEPFPALSVSEDCHTWFRYAAHPGKFVFIREIKGGYRICSGVQSRSRSLNSDFYERMFAADSDGFEKAVKLAEKYGTTGGMNVNDIRAGFYVRVALNLLYAESYKYCKEALEKALNISREKTFEYIDSLYCEPVYKTRMKEILQ